MGEPPGATATRRGAGGAGGGGKGESGKQRARLLAALSALPNAVEVQTAGIDTLCWMLGDGDVELNKQARESAAYGLVLGAPFPLGPPAATHALLTPVR